MRESFQSLILHLVLTGIFFLCVAGLWFLARRLVRRFCALGRFARVLVVTMVTVAALLAQKPDGDNDGNGAGDGGEGDGQQQQQSAPRRIRTPNWSGNETETTNLFAVTDFRVVASNQTVSFTVAWNESYLAAMDSRYADIFFSTNLLSPAWMPIGSRYLPWDTNRLDFTIGPWLDDWTYHSAFTNSFGSSGFFTLGLDFDSDGDGLTDAYEKFVTGTSPLLIDTDGDGVDDRTLLLRQCRDFRYYRGSKRTESGAFTSANHQLFSPRHFETAPY